MKALNFAVGIALIVLVGLAGAPARGESVQLFSTNSSPTEAKPEVDPSGFWLWSMTTPGGETRELTGELKLENGKLTGTLSAANFKIPITNGVVRGTNVYFETMRPGGMYVTKYSGGVAGNSIRGEFDAPNNQRKQRWRANRLTAEDLKYRKATGTWRVTYTSGTGQAIEPTVEIRRKGDQLMGTLKMNEEESPLSDLQFQEDTLRFTHIRERDGKKLITRYEGKIYEQSLEGTINANWAGVEKSYTFEAKKMR
jgi:hypothetical protein